MKYLLDEKEMEELKHSGRSEILLNVIKRHAKDYIDHGNCLLDSHGYCSKCVIAKLTPYTMHDQENGKCLGGRTTYYPK